MDCRLPTSSVLGILQARTLEWVAIPFSRGSSWPRDWTWVSCSAGRFFTSWVMLSSQPISEKPEGDGAQIRDSYAAHSNMGITKSGRSGLEGGGRDESSQKNKTRFHFQWCLWGLFMPGFRNPEDCRHKWRFQGKGVWTVLFPISSTLASISKWKTEKRQTSVR